MNKTFWILGGAIVLVVIIVLLKKKADNDALLAAGGVPGGYPPSPYPTTPQGALSTLLATPPSQLAGAALTTAINHYLPTVGNGVSTTKAETFVPGGGASDPGDCTSMWRLNPNYTGPAPLDPRIICNGTPRAPGSPSGMSGAAMRMYASLTAATQQGYV